MQRYLSILSSPPPGYRQARKKPAAAAPPARKAAADFPPDQSVGYLVREAHRAFLRALGARVSRHGVSIGMWYFLRAIRARPRRGERRDEPRAPGSRRS